MIRHILKWLDQFGLSLWVSSAFFFSGIAWLRFPELVDVLIPTNTSIITAIWIVQGFFELPATMVYSFLEPSDRVIAFGYATAIVTNPNQISIWSYCILATISVLLGWGILKLSTRIRGRRILQIGLFPNLFSSGLVLLQNATFSHLSYKPDQGHQYQLRFVRVPSLWGY